MDIASIVIIILIAVILIITFYIIGIYNELVNAKNKIEYQFIQIDKELEELTKIILNIIEVLTKKAKYEEKILNNLSQIELDKTSSINEKIEVYSKISRTLKKVYKLKETYPKLNNDKEFIEVEEKSQKQITKINYASEFYDKSVEEYNNLKSKNPHKFVAQMFKLEEYKLFR